MQQFVLHLRGNEVSSLRETLSLCVKALVESRDDLSDSDFDKLFSLTYVLRVLEGDK